MEVRDEGKKTVKMQDTAHAKVLRPVNGKKVSVAGAQGKAGLHVVSERAAED